MGACLWGLAGQTGGSGKAQRNRVKRRLKVEKKLGPAFHRAWGLRVLRVLEKLNAGMYLVEPVWREGRGRWSGPWGKNEEVGGGKRLSIVS